jgi:glucokinase
MTLVLGIDVGGTKVTAALVDAAAGRVLAHETEPTGVSERTPQEILDACVALGERVAGPQRPAAVGIGLCELVDLDGRPTSAATIDWRDVDVAGAFAHVGSTLVESDVRAAALAESRLGAGRGVDAPWLYVGVGTGISHTLVVDGRPYCGARGNALITGAPPVEQVASGLALERGNAGRDDAADALGTALAFLVNALDPAIVVVGGGLGLVDAYRERAVAAMRALIEAPDTAAAPVVPAMLGAEAGAIGAALAAADRVGVRNG